MSLPTAPLGDLLAPVKTWNPRRAAGAEFFEYIDLSSVDRDEKAIVSPTPTDPSEAPSRARQLVKSGDILVSTVRPNLNAVAAVGEELDGATASTGFSVLRPAAGKADSRYIYHWVRTPSFVSDMVRKATGASYPAVSDKIVAESLIPLPPLEEQRRIAGILDAADALRRRRREALTLLDTLPGAIFAEMFLSSSPGEPERPSQALGNLVDAVSGSTPSKGNKAFWDGDIPWISPKDMKTDDLDRAIINITDEATKTGKAKLVGPDVTLIVIRGMILAHSVPICDLRVPASFNQDVKALIPKKGVSNIFISAALRASKNRLLSMVSNAAHGTKRIEMGDLMKFPIPTATEAEQAKFVKAIAGAAAQRARFKGASHDGETLFASLQSRAFAGAL